MSRSFQTSPNLQATPVIIPARQEEANIGRTLDTLAGQSRNILPIVVINGQSDGTADIASDMGATVIESTEGKMPAIQAGLAHLGREALKPLLILDADTRPYSKHWGDFMTKALAEHRPAGPSIVWGPYIFSGELSPAIAAICTAATLRVSWADRHKDMPRAIRGGNTGLRLQNIDALEKIMDLDNFWPREDVAIYDSLKSLGAQHEVLFNPKAWAITSGSRANETLKATLKLRMHPSLAMDRLYEAEAPPHSLPYNSATTATVKH